MDGKKDSKRAKEMCQFCEKFMRPDNLKEHIKRSHENKKENCEYCAKSFYNSSSLKRHIPLCTANPNVVSPNTVSNETFIPSGIDAEKVAQGSRIFIITYYYYSKFRIN